MKSEPDEFSLDDLRASHGGVAQWDGVRNAQARNLMKTMRVGDRAFFYHSSCKVPAVVGICEVVTGSLPGPHRARSKSTGLRPKVDTDEQPVALRGRRVHPGDVANGDAE